MNFVKHYEILKIKSRVQAPQSCCEEYSLCNTYSSPDNLVTGYLTWEEMYEYAKAYYNFYHNLEVPYKFKTNNGYSYDENGTINLGKWIATQRRNCDLESERGKKLTNIGMCWENKISTLSWEEMYEYAKIYYNFYHNLEVLKNFKTNDGYTYDENGTINLGNWIATQRRNCDLESERGEKLTNIGMCWENKISNLSWEEMYKYAKIYYKFNHNLEIPSKFKTNDGYTYDENGTIKLGQWIATQRISCNQESERGKKLTEIEMRWENKRNILTWEEMYEYAKAYYNFYHNLEIQARFKTNNGYTYAENGTINLGTWLVTQRRICNPESEQGKKLTAIGMRWENMRNILPWEEMYEYAKAYYNFYHNLKVPAQFKTNNGYTYDENGTINLGNWIYHQRRICNPENEQGQLLSIIGMVWDIKKNKNEIIEVCEEYNIDYSLNKTILKHISIQEFQSKIKFLKEHNISIVDNKGLLIDIFSMSSLDMKEKYGFYLEEIITYYTTKKRNQGG